MRMFALPLLPQPTQVAARLLNALLKREGWARSRLADYSGKTVCLALGNLPLSLSIAHDGYVQASDSAVTADVKLTLPADKLPDLPSLLRTGDFSQVSALMHVQGEAGLANVVSQLARELRWDYEDDLARVLGDTLALRLISGVRAIGRSARIAGDRLIANTGEFLGEESDMMLSQPSLRLFAQDLDQIEQSLQRLEARLERLEVKR